MATAGALPAADPRDRRSQRPGPGRNHPVPPHDLSLAKPRVGRRSRSCVVTAVMWLVTPPAGRGKTARDLGIVLGKSEIEPPAPVAKPTPGQWLEHSPILNWLIVSHRRHVSGPLLHAGGRTAERDQPQHRQPHLSAPRFPAAKTPARLMHAVQGATPAVWGVILQFPFYAGIAGIITSTHLNQRIADAFVGDLTPRKPFRR